MRALATHVYVCAACLAWLATCAYVTNSIERIFHWTNCAFIDESKYRKRKSPIIQFFFGRGAPDPMRTQIDLIYKLYVRERTPHERTHVCY